MPGRPHLTGAQDIAGHLLLLWVEQTACNLELRARLQDAHPAVRTSGLTRWASATRRSSAGSLKLRHHSSVCACGMPRCSAVGELSEPLDQAASHGTSGR